MFNFMYVLHLTAICLVVGTLFVQSLAVIFRLRLTDPMQISGAQWVQYRIYKFIYYPILLVAIITGMYLAYNTNAFSAGKWLHWKLVCLTLLIGFGFLNGRQINENHLPKPFAMLVHIGIFLTAATMIYLVKLRPY